jgi:hypothetical protein
MPNQIPGLSVAKVFRFPTHERAKILLEEKRNFCPEFYIQRKDGQVYRYRMENLAKVQNLSELTDVFVLWQYLNQKSSPETAMAIVRLDFIPRGSQKTEMFREIMGFHALVTTIWKKNEEQQTMYLPFDQDAEGRIFWAASEDSMTSIDLSESLGQDWEMYVVSGLKIPAEPPEGD